MPGPWVHESWPACGTSAMWPWWRMESASCLSPSSVSDILFCQGLSTKGQVGRGMCMASSKSQHVTGIGKPKPTACPLTWERNVSKRETASSTFSDCRRRNVSSSMMHRVLVSIAKAPKRRAKPRTSSARPGSCAPLVASQRPSRNSPGGTSRAKARAAPPNRCTTAGAWSSGCSSVPALQTSTSCSHTLKGQPRFSSAGSQ